MSRAPTAQPQGVVGLAVELHYSGVLWVPGFAARTGEFVFLVDTTGQDWMMLAGHKDTLPFTRPVVNGP